MHRCIHVLVRGLGDRHCNCVMGDRHELDDHRAQDVMNVLGDRRYSYALDDHRCNGPGDRHVNRALDGHRVKMLGVMNVLDGHRYNVRVARRCNGPDDRHVNRAWVGHRVKVLVVMVLMLS